MIDKREEERYDWLVTCTRDQYINITNDFFHAYYTETIHAVKRRYENMLVIIEYCFTVVPQVICLSRKSSGGQVWEEKFSNSTSNELTQYSQMEYGQMIYSLGLSRSWLRTNATLFIGKPYYLTILTLRSRKKYIYFLKMVKKGFNFNGL